MRIVPGSSFFLIGLIVAIALAYLAPHLGTPRGPLPITTLSTLAVFIIFFNQGITLPRESLHRSVKEWKLHALIQFTTYLFFPLIVALMIWLNAPWCQHPSLRSGFLYLSFLPTTVASATALTILAKGNVAGALFNATLSSILAVFIVPTLCLIFLLNQQLEISQAWTHILSQTALTILLPFFLGQLTSKWLNAFYQRHTTAIRHLNTSLILLIVWFAFCKSFEQRGAIPISWTDLSWTLIGTLTLLAASAAWIWFTSARISLSHPSRIAAFYCGNQKSVAVGLPLSSVIFGSITNPIDLSLLLLPLLIYHTAQLILGGWLVTKF